MKNMTEDNRICFVSPLNGDCLNQHDGTEKDGRLYIRVRLQAPKGASICVNDVPAVYRGPYFEAELPLSGRRTTLSATDINNPENSCKIVVYDFRHGMGKYRISSDDNILFLQDITQKQNQYHSIFENPYLAVYREAHERFGAKVHLNIFHEFQDASFFSAHKEPFALSMVTDKFKKEWEANSDWLHLSFHAKSEFPNRPYQHTSYAEIVADAEAVNREIIRFAGEKTLAKVCTVHWGELNLEGMRALRNLGYRALSGYFEMQENGKPLVAYHYPASMVRHIGGRDFYYNTEEDVLHSRIDLVLNTISYEQLLPSLEKIQADSGRNGFLELMIHEQYFYPDYSNYIPAFKMMVLDAAQWAWRQGYQGAFLEEMLRE